MQLNLFASLKPDTITDEFLLNYLRLNYPEMKFETYTHFGDIVIKSFLSKKVNLYFNVVFKSRDDDFWCRRFDRYISINMQKLYGNYEGLGRGVDTIDEFKKEAERVIARAKQFVEEYKNYKKESEEQ